MQTTKQDILNSLLEKETFQILSNNAVLTAKDITEILGEKPKRVASWVGNGLLPKQHTITHQNLFLSSNKYRRRMKTVSFCCTKKQLLEHLNEK